MAKESWVWLAAGLGWGAVNTGELLAACPGGAEEVAAGLGGQKLDAVLTQKQAERLAQSRPEDFALRVKHAEAQGIHVLGYDDGDYPAALRTIHNPPPVLYVKGDVGLMNGQLTIGMVGARRPSAYGVEVARAIGRGVALGGAIIASGLAAGLDAEAHKAALAVNGPTVACIAFGHDHCYPAANRKLMEVIERYGAVISEYPLGTGPEKPFFLQRNRLIAGFSHGLLVVEARKYSGTMSTVNFAIDYGRDVFAVPGSVFSELSGGTNAMIREGAYLAASATDILAVYGVEFGGEDPVEAAAKQAQKGRPEPAGAQPPWQQSVRRHTTRETRAAQPAAAGQVGAVAAIEAFRQLQQMPAQPEGARDAKDAALSRRAEAVSDEVTFSSAGRSAGGEPGGAAEKPKTSGAVEPFPWHRVEHLDREQTEKQREPKPAAGKGGKPSLASRLFGGGQAPADSPKTGASEPAVAPQREVPTAKPADEAPLPPAAPQRSEAPAAPKPVGDRRDSLVRGDASLAGRLQTLAQKQAPAKGGKSPRRDVVEVARFPAAAETPPSEPARRALEQLGPTPVSLAELCERSGLSPAEAMAALTELELAGRSRQLAGRQFVAGP